MIKRFFSFVSAIIILFLFCGAVWWVGWGSRVPEEVSVISPVPDFLSLNKNNQVTLLDLWLPFVQQTYGQFDIEALTAKSVLMYDLTEDKVIYEKNERVRRPMASLTKIMTAIISLENKRQDDRYAVHGADLVGEDSMGLSVGEVLTLEELLYGLLLPSGNDASEVLASNYPRGRDAFVRAMNDKAKSLGLTDTVFSNPSGLQGDGEQYTTAYDMLVITRYALDNFPLFRKIVATPEYTLSATSGHKEFYLISETNLLTTYPGVKGVKTGYTPEAGMCLISYLDYDGHKIIGIILNSQNRRQEMKELLDYSLKKSGITPPPFKGE